MKTRWLLGACAIAMLSPAVQAQVVPAAPPVAPQADTGQDGDGPLAEIVVTAQKRSENVQRVPIAISAFNANALQERAATNVAALSNLAPNVTLDAGTPFSGSSSVLAAYIRGIGSNDFAFNIDPGVGIYLDGVYLARSVGANQDLPDVDRVEVLKGPQGTLFGRNTIGGAISIVTHTPGKDFRFVGDVTTGSYNLLQVRGTVDVPLADGLYSSLTFGMKKRQGYLRRIAFPGASSYAGEPFTSFRSSGFDGGGLGREGGDDSWNARAKIHFDKGGPVRATLAGDYGFLDQPALPTKIIATTQAALAGTYNCAIAARSTNCGDGPPPFAYAQPRAGIDSIAQLPPIYGVNVDNNRFNDRLPFDDRFLTSSKDTSYATGNNFSKLKNYGVAATVDFDLSDNVLLRSITAYRGLNWKSGADLDGSPLNFHQTSFAMNQWQLSEELQLLGNLLDNRLKYVLGAYAFHEQGDLHDYVTFAEGLVQVDGPNSFKTRNFAAFGQVDFRVSDLIGLTAGGRYTNEKKEFEGFQSEINGLTYKILNYLGAPQCASLMPISDACRVAAGYFNAGEPLRVYFAGRQKKKFDNFSPKLGIQLYPTERVMVYGSWSKGYKTGGWTTRLTSPLPYAPDFNEEKATTWEAGVKSQLFDRRLQLNVAAFTTDYSNVQLNFQQGLNPVIQNAGDARIKGVEVEAVLAPTRGFTINGSVGYIDAHYTRVAPGAVVAPSATQAGVFVGAPLPKTPKWKLNLSPRYETDLGNGGQLVMLASWTHSTRLRNDTEGTYLVDRPATDVVDANITYREPNRHWELAVGGTNLTNDRYLTVGAGQIAGGVFYGTYNRPAEWYARLGVKF